MNSPWVIGVLSTDYDLHDYRQAVISCLQDAGAIPSAFELPDFPVETDEHTHDACLTALKRTHIALLIVDKRYGGIYYDSATVSITEKEYLETVEQGIPCLVFANKEAWNERHAYFTDLKASGKSEEEFAKGYKCKHVNQVETLCFLEFLRKAYEKNNISGWISFFDDIPGLISEIKGKLSGLSRFWLREIVKEQCKTLKARKTSTCFAMSLGDVFDKGYYLNPEYSIESGEVSGATKELEHLVVGELCQRKSVFIYGEAGYGKTTILAKSFISHAEKFFQDDGYEIPFYIWLKNKDSQYHFDFAGYLQECFEEFWNRKPYPFLNVDSIKPFFYLDGLDELAEKLNPEEVERISQSVIFKSPILLTCRYQYALRNLHGFDLVNKFHVRVKINQWNKSKAIEYINNFCTIRSMDKKFKERVYALLTDNNDLSNVLDNPLLITMLLWVIEENRMSIPETMTTRVELFQAYLKLMARRECGEGRLCNLGENELMLIWSYFAWLFYEKKLQRKPARIKTLLSDIQSTYLPEYEQDYNESVFEAVFDTNEEIVFGTFHEQFLEFLVANTWYFACLKKIQPYPTFLRYVVRPEINKYFRGIWDAGIENEKNTVAENIFTMYMDKLGLDDDKSIRIRVHAIYHVTRLKCEKREEYIKRAFALEQEIPVKLSLFFGAIKMGQLDKEQKFYDLLCQDKEYSIENRGYHLAYYADMQDEGELPLKDTGNEDWSSTLKAFVRHFESGSQEHYFLWRIDLVTMLQLMEERGEVGPLTLENLNILEEHVNSPCVKGYDDFQKNIELEFDKVKNKYNELYMNVNR